ncbi:hypothetical protein HQ560_13190, partial [bacterium]|nr:hypothetical protein [bacterium]
MVGGAGTGTRPYGPATGGMLRLARLLPLTLLLFLVAAASARAEYGLRIGEETVIPLQIENHDSTPVCDLRLKLRTTQKKDDPKDWVTVTVTDEGGAALDGDANDTAWKLPVIAAKSSLDLEVHVTIDKTARANALARLLFTLWRQPGKSGATGAKGKKPTDRLSVPICQSWRTLYRIRAVELENAMDPPPFDWHLFRARKGSKNNKVTLKVTNTSEADTLKRITADGISARLLCELKEGNEGDLGAKKLAFGIPGLEPQGEGKIDYKFSVSSEAALGDTDVIHLTVRSASAGARPDPWQPKIFVNVARPAMGVPGNFECIIRYNLPPAKGEGVSDDAEKWLPVPKGAKVTVSQTYKLRDGGGVKDVEQFIGYGNVLDDKGYFRCTIRPEGHRELRLRLVVDTLASHLNLKTTAVPGGKDGKIVDVLKSVKAGRAWAAVTPHGKRVFRNISRKFLVSREAAATSIERPPRWFYHDLKEFAYESWYGTPQDLTPKAKSTYFYRPHLNQDGNFVAGKDTLLKTVLIPYHGYAHALDAARPKGIQIRCEGELSTDGHITFNARPPSDLGMAAMGGVTGGAGVVTNYQDIYSSQVSASAGVPGITYHNHNELLHILSGIVRAQEFLSKLQFFSPTMQYIMLPGEKAPAPPDQRGVIAYWRKGLDIKGGETGYARRDDGTWRLMVQGKKSDPDERDLGLVLRGMGAAVRHFYFKRPEGADTKDEGKAATYKYYEPTDTLRGAWEQGFDIFFAACVLDNETGAVLNKAVGGKTSEKGDAPDAATAGKKAGKSRSVVLDTVLIEARKAGGKGVMKPSLAKYRGADNPVAVAAGLWTAVQSGHWSSEALVSEILSAKGGDLGWFLG